MSSESTTGDPTCSCEQNQMNTSGNYSYGYDYGGGCCHCQRYCPCCGRPLGHHTYPWNPYQPWYPYQPYQPYWQISPNMCDGTFMVGDTTITVENNANANG